jgi:RNase H-like domain found in reverse transcriptase/Reverse transcriptase (RNA-dependent DNA polymerase)/Retroviral aspartyl protease/Integrase zinc binding domain
LPDSTGHYWLQEEPVDDTSPPQLPVEEQLVTLSGTTSLTSHNTLKYKGFIQTIPICVLIDTGATHSFINPHLVHVLELPVQPQPTKVFRSAGDERLITDKYCPQVEFTLQDHKFTADLKLLPVPGYDIILGCDWISKMGDVTINLQKGCMVVSLEGKQIKLPTSPILADVHIIDSVFNVTKEEKKGSHLFTAHIFPVLEDQIFTVETLHPKLQELLESFAQLFVEPTQLPPKRSIDHQIQLKPDAKPVNMRPYRFSHFQKLEIEKITSELLQKGFIQPCTSSFSSPVLLVKKKDGTWRMVVDYRRLNGETVKSKFPIPLVDDLLDELEGMKFFSKLDLRSGYHQIRMHEEDVHKTAFQTHEGLFHFLVMPFGLTNAPATFQALMNSIFKPILRKCVIVFFDDILIYSDTWEAHMDHLQQVFQILLKAQLYVKLSKCVFAATQLEYLGHIISHEGVATDPKKVQSMLTWPVPTTLKDLRGFLGLTGYYRRFVKFYGTIAKPLTDLLKKDSFQWNSSAQQAFEALKLAMSTAPVLKLPNFSQPFIIETDACLTGLGAVLMQDNRPIAYLSKKLGVRTQGLSTYEKELLALCTAVTKWRHYLLGGEFTIKTDQISLKYLLEQKINTPMQHKGLSKLLGLNYKIEYKKGIENKVADALSRIHHGGSSQDPVIHVVSELIPQWIEDVKLSYLNDPWITKLKSQLSSSSDTHLSEYMGLIRYKGKICVGNAGDWRQKIIFEMHDSSQGGHSGISATYHRIKRNFYWPSLKDSVHSYIQQCPNCQMNKGEHIHPPGLLQPLPIPHEAWSSIGMDFITGLPKSKGYEVILVIVDRLTKYSHFLPLTHPYSATSVAQLFLDNIYKLHGIPSSIVSDRDPIFTSRFWKELMNKLDVKLKMSTAFHPQTDGQTEKVNQCLEQYLRAMVFDKTNKWANYLSLAEWWYNSTWNSAINQSPFEALYGYPPPVLALGSAPRSRVANVNTLLRDRQAALAQLKSNLKRAQERMKKNADLKRSERAFAIGDWVYLKLQPYRQITVGGTRNNKLSPKFYGPFEILQKLGQVAYRLNVPAGSQIHPVFHVSQLKGKLGTRTLSSPLQPLHTPISSPSQQPYMVIGRRILPKNNAPQVQWLVQWLHQSPEDATWENYEEFVAKYPEFVREDTNFLEEGAMQRHVGIDSVNLLIFTCESKKMPNGYAESATEKSTQRNGPRHSLLAQQSPYAFVEKESSYNCLANVGPKG